MAYVLNGVGIGVEVSPQAVRPRELARPSVAVTTKSPEMATRALRPRESTVVVAGQKKSAVIDVRLKEVAAARAQEVKTQIALKKKGQELAVAKVALIDANRSGSLPATAAAQAVVARKGAEVNTLITSVKQSAEKANVAAGAAINVGATRAEVKAASVAGATNAPVPTVVSSPKPAVSVPAPSVVSAPVKVIPAPSAPVRTHNPAVIIMPPSKAIETNSAGIRPDGIVTVGPDAAVVDTPVQSDPSVDKSDVVVSSGSLGTLALVGVVGFLGFRWLKKKGFV